MNFEGFLLSILFSILAFFGLWIIVKIYFIVTIQKLLKQIAPENRCISNQSLWYILIPIYNLYWNFVVASKISYSLKLEYYSKGLIFKNTPLSNIGPIWAITSSFYLIVFLVKFSSQLIFIISVLGMFLSMASIILFFSYWLLIIEHKKILVAIEVAQN
jgi:hypothetical protein